jgi:hypothetical protein
MNTYTPDRWVVIDIATATDRHSRVFAGWYGGYTSGDSWKMNSGITEVQDHGEFIDFVGESGSVYKCHKHGYGMSGYMFNILEGFIAQGKDEGVIITINDNFEPKETVDEQH